MWWLLCFTLHLAAQIEGADLAGATLDTWPGLEDLGNSSTKELTEEKGLTFEDLVPQFKATPEVSPLYWDTTPEVPLPRLDATPEVVVPGLGSVRGSLSYTYRLNRTVFNFRAVPYAQSPSGPRRFQVGNW